MNSKRLLGFGGCLLLGVMTLAGPAKGETDADLKGRLERAETRIAELETHQSQTWLNARRVEEVKTLIHEVLADADTRASLLEGGATAGHNGQHFFLSNNDGSFLLEVGGIIQVRHLYNFQNSDTTDEQESGFEVARAKVNFSGHIASPRLHYSVLIATDRNDNEALVEEAVISYDLADGLTLWGGETKAPFLREELTASSHQSAVERSLVNEVFTLGSVQGIGLDWSVDKDSGNTIRARLSFNDGIRSGEADGKNDAGIHKANTGLNNKVFDADHSDAGLTARVDLRLMGDWAQADDFAAWGDENTALFAGGAVHWEVGETGDGGGGADNNTDFFTWTVDASAECNGLGLYGAFVGLHTDYENTASDRDLYGTVLQGSYQIVPNKMEPFVRWEWLDMDDVSLADDSIQLLTFGVNWFLNNHNAKFTTDLVWALDTIPSSGDLGIEAESMTLLGLLQDDAGEEDQVIWRMQFQLLF